MTVYGPDIEEAFEAYSAQFDDLQVTARTNIIDLNAINPLSELREDWSNVSSNQTEHVLQTSDATDEKAYLRSEERGQYTPGYEAQAGIGVRLPSNPSKDETIRWGYFRTDSNNDPKDGWYFGVDAQGVFVCEVRNGVKDKVYQDDWNVDIADGTGFADRNKSGFDLSLSKGNIFQIGFVYYGYGVASMEVLTDDGKITLHEFTHDGQTSVENTNLPLQAQIDNGSTTSDAQTLYVGGRQFSVIGSRSVSERQTGHYRDSITVDDTKWYPAISIKIKDGTDIGSINFEHVIGEVKEFETDTDATGYRWQIRRSTTPDNPSWETPSTHVDKQDETAIKVDTNSTSITDGSGNLTGVFVDGGVLESGSKNSVTVNTEDTAGQITEGNVVTVSVQAVPGGSGTISSLFLQWTESW